MDSITFGQVEVSISGRVLIAENVNISENNSVTPNYSIGYINPIDYTPAGGIKNSIEISYILTPYTPTFGSATDAILYSILPSLKNYQQIYQPTQISVGGITGSGYLESYS